jgi:predicted Zn-dependent peptidase
MSPDLFRLASGLTVLHDRRPQHLTTTIGLFIMAGPVDEKPEAAGVAHLVEHMLLNGTETRSAEDVSRAFDLAGGHLQAFTAKEHTCLFSRVLATETGPAIEVMFDLVMHPVFDPVLFEREKRIVAEESRLGADSPQRHVIDLGLLSLWPESAFGRSILGLPERVAGLTPDDARVFHATHYRPTGMVAVVDSPLPAAEIRSVLEAVAGEPGSWRAGRGAPLPRIAPRIAPGLVVTRAATQQVHLCLSFPAPALGDPQAEPVTILSTLLGGSVAGRLPRVLRREDGLVYLVSTSFIPYTAGGAFQVYAGATPSSVDRVIHLCLRELGRIAREAPSADELHRARQRVKGALASAQEQPGDRTTMAGKEQLLLGRIRDPVEVLRAYDAVTLDDLLGAARAMFRPELMACAAIGPVDWTLDDLARFRTRLAEALSAATGVAGIDAPGGQP